MNYSNVVNKIEEWPQQKVYAFGNSFSTTPLRKVCGAKLKFEEILSKRQSHQTKDELVKDLMELLCNREKHWPDDELYRRAPTWGDTL